jgi:hypothetical protein
MCNMWVNVSLPTPENNVTCSENNLPENSEDAKLSLSPSDTVRDEILWNDNMERMNELSTSTNTRFRHL